MNAETFKQRASLILGGRGWQGRLARGMETNTSTVGRWANGITPVPGSVVALLEFLAMTPEAFWPARWFEPERKA